MTSPAVAAERGTAPEAADAPRAGTLAAVFDPRLNGLNLLRLALAVGVILRHSFTMLGERAAWTPAEVLMRSVFVDGFFAISGFLIIRSWVERPDARRFLRARALRILPGFWVCLLVVAFVAAPVHAWLRGEAVDAAFLTDAWGYVWHNAALWIFQDGIDGGPLGASAAEAGTWNGSLWTLSWEFACYLGVLALGLLGLLRRRWVVPALFVLALATLLVTLVPAYDVAIVHHAARFATMFLAGALVYQARTWLPVRGWLVAACVALVVASAALPDYRAVGALPLAYACVAGGAMIKVPALRLRTDLSYGAYIYAFPVQQLLVALGLAAWGVGGYFLASVAVTAPLAALSWFVVERPALHLKDARRRARVAPEAAPARTAEAAQAVPDPIG
ncbi:acyltransferase family protein [Cellulomonas massiliensis]|uniref:acyltransferase family protein n=1 Tax=Cellulomonas massiliensis TaxID=1465811 RepID=UPI0002F3D14A|nr:acyltransferase [Cellulomonas massiliensis]